MEPRIIDSSTAYLLIDPYNDYLSEGGKIWPRVELVATQVGLLDYLGAPTPQSRRRAYRSSSCRIAARPPSGDCENWDHPNPASAPLLGGRDASLADVPTCSRAWQKVCEGQACQMTLASMTALTSTMVEILASICICGKNAGEVGMTSAYAWRSHLGQQLGSFTTSCATFERARYLARLLDAEFAGTAEHLLLAATVHYRRAFSSKRGLSAADLGKLGAVDLVLHRQILEAADQAVDHSKDPFDETEVGVVT